MGAVLRGLLENCRSLKVAESRLWLREQCEIWFMISSKTLFHDKLIGFHPNYGLWKYNTILISTDAQNIGDVLFCRKPQILSNLWEIHKELLTVWVFVIAWTIEWEKRISLISQLFLLEDNEMKQRSFPGVSYFSEFVKQKDPSVSSRASQQIVLRFILSHLRQIFRDLYSNKKQIATSEQIESPKDLNMNSNSSKIK